MSNARNLARVVADTSGAIAATNLANAVPADGSITNAKIVSVAASKLTGQVAKANAPSGSVIQVVSQTFGTDFVSSTAGWLDLGLSATITPTSSSNKIYVTATVVILNTSNGNSASGMGWRVANSSNTVIIDSPGDSNPFDFSQYLTVGWYNQSTVQTKQLLHSPNTTSAYTYKVQINRGTAGDPPRFNYRGGATNFSPVCVLTLMEVAA